MSANNSKPKNAAAPVIVLREEPSSFGRYMLLMLPAMIGSVLFHAGLIGAFVAYIFLTAAPEGPVLVASTAENITDAEPEKDKASFMVESVDPSMAEADVEINYKNNRIEDVSVPGSVNANEAVGIKDGDKTAAPMNLPNPGGYSTTTGQGGAQQISGIGNSMAVGEVGGSNSRGLPLQGTFYGRSGATREYALRDGGGTRESEAAVAKGLRWLISQQQSNGCWSLSSSVNSNPIAGTAFGLLPFLAAGKTHKNPGKDNPYDKQIGKGLRYLVEHQGKDGYYGHQMYSHALATITLCEAYGLSQDPSLRRPAQVAINVILKAQSDTGGGWGYEPNSAERDDMSVSGWQIMALKSGQMAGLIVPSMAIERAKTFLKSNCNESDAGYSYRTGKGGSTYRMTAVGLLCRQYMENWGPANPQMINAVKKFIKANPPDRQDVYYYYYATQVMHHMGGSGWHDWNEKMRDYLVKRQDLSKAYYGSWSPEGEMGIGTNNRLIVTSLNLLTLEVYYRYLPLYYRDAGYGKDAAVQKSL